MAKRHCEIEIVGERSILESVVWCIRSSLVPIIAFLSIIFGAIYYSLIWIPVVFIYQPIQQFFSEIIFSVWYQFLCMLFPLLGTKFVVTGDASRFPDRCLVVMNHRSRFDWLFYWGLVDKLANHRYTKIVLKSGLRNLPGIGCMMQMCGYIFLKRNWDQDKVYVEQVLSYYRLSGCKYQILLFPEGTNLTARTVGICNKFAAANNLPEHTYTLHPRYTGFLFLLHNLSKHSDAVSNETQLDGLVDITVGYKGHFLVDEIMLIKGYIPEEIHLHVKQYRMSEIPSSDVERENWLREVWREKEERLKKFYEQDYSFGPEVRNLSEKSSLKKLLLILFWTSPFVITYFLWLYHPLILLGFFLLIPLFYYLQYSYDGLDTLIASRYLKHSAKNS